MQEWEKAERMKEMEKIREINKGRQKLEHESNLEENGTAVHSAHMYTNKQTCNKRRINNISID